MVYQQNEHFLHDLRRGFLLRSDAHAVEACIDLFDATYDATGIAPEYTSIASFQKDAKRLLSRYGMSSMNVEKVLCLLQEPVHRLDLYMSMRGLRRGFYDFAAINELEEYALEHFSIEHMYTQHSLFEFSIEDERVQALYDRLYGAYRLNMDVRRHNERMVRSFSERRLKPLILRLNSMMDRQLCFSGKGIIEEQTDIAEEDLRKLYRHLVGLLLKYTEIIDFRAYWKSINQRVLSRYR